jgi:hypothetical protein
MRRRGLSASSFPAQTPLACGGSTGQIAPAQTMKKLPKILLIVSILLALVEFVPSLRDAFYTIHRPFSAVFFGLFVVTQIMAKENDSEPHSSSHSTKGKH